MAQGYQSIFPNTQENLYTQITPTEQDLYPYFVANGTNAAFSQQQAYHYERGCQYINQQASPSYYQVQNNTQFHTPAQHNQLNPRLIQRQKNRIVPTSNPEIPHKRIRVEDQMQMHLPQIYQTDTEAIPRVVYQQRPVDTPYPQSTKHPLETQSNGHSSPSRSPILNISTSPNISRGTQEELKCPHQVQRVPVDTYYRNTHVSPTISVPQLESTESNTSIFNPVSTMEPGTEILDTILIPDEDESSELVIVSVKSPTLPRQDQVNSPALSSTHALFEEPEVSYESNLPDMTQQLPVQNIRHPPVMPVNNTVETNQYFTPEHEYPPQPIPVTSYMNPVQAPFYLAFPQQTESYSAPFYSRTCMPNTFYTYPQQMMARAPMQNNFRRIRPYEYHVPTVYSPSNFPRSQPYFSYEEAPLIVSHPPVPHSHRSKKPGMTRAELKRLDVKKYKMADYEEKDESCVICMDEYKDGDKLYVLPCKHEYHRDCVKDWLIKQRNCPLCRKEVHPK